MNIYQYIKELKEKNQGKSFAVLAERCETSEENPHRIKIAQPLKPEETCVVIIPGMHEKENDQYLRLYNSILKKVHDFVNKTPKFTENQVRVCVTVRSLGKFHDYEKATALSSCVRSPICVRAPVCSRRCSACVPMYSLILDIFHIKT